MEEEEEVTRILTAIEDGEKAAAEDLLPILYDELRRLAAARVARESPGITLPATALVHEAYLRLLGPEGESRDWDSRGHFFAAAAEAMRRILIENARRRKSLKRGGDQVRITFESANLAVTGGNPDEILAVNEALERLQELDSQSAKLVELRFFTGLTLKEAGAALGISEATAKRRWAFARAWLKREIGQPE